MNQLFEALPFQPADILVPQNCDMSLWSVVACDQYTSQPEYWQRVEERVGRAPSALRLILPESCLEGPSVEMDIMEINNTMTRYLRNDQFTQLPQTMVYVERILGGGKMRHGLMGVVDLDQYEYEPGASAPIRATEGTVLTRIPPRVAVRKNAPIELPHVLLLVDDPKRTVVEGLAQFKDNMEQVYDFDLMEGGGHITGWKLGDGEMDYVAQELTKLADPADFNARYGLDNQPVLLFAVGDGNHSLATAKECYERRKKLTSTEQWPDLLSRYALCELGNLHDDSLEFEPIHRVVFGVEPDELIQSFLQYYPNATLGGGEGHALPFVYGGATGVVMVPNPSANLPVGTLQNFLDTYLAQHPKATVDYIHGEDVVHQLASQPNAVGFLLPAMGKEELFPTVIHDGVLPRKTFSMGEAHDKRFYLEARKIRV